MNFLFGLIPLLFTVPTLGAVHFYLSRHIKDDWPHKGRLLQASRSFQVVVALAIVVDSAMTFGPRNAVRPASIPKAPARVEIQSIPREAFTEKPGEWRGRFDEMLDEPVADRQQGGDQDSQGRD